MLSEKQLSEIRNFVDESSEPLFFFDNDADGLASFLLLRRYRNAGKGIAIKSFPMLNASYARKIHELNGDTVFVLDKPGIEQGFVEEAKKAGVKFVWIDHHKLDSESAKINNYIRYYNPHESEKPSSEPVSYWCYQATARKEDLWIAMIGCIGDGYMPSFADEFARKYPDLWKPGIGRALNAMYETELGKIIRILNFALKDRTTNVVRMLKFLVTAKSPYELLEENSRTYTMLRRAKQIEKKYRKLLERARKHARGRVLFFQYGGSLSLSADLANELAYLYPDKIIVVAYIKGSKANISLRGELDMREITRKAIAGLEDATGGGHKHATGAQVSVEDLPVFRKRIIRLVTS